MDIQREKHILVYKLVGFLCSLVNMNKLHIHFVKLSNDYLGHKPNDHMDLLEVFDHKLLAVDEYMAYMIQAHLQYNLLDRSKLVNDLQLDRELLCHKHFHMDLHTFDLSMIYPMDNLDLQHILAGIQLMDYRNNLFYKRMLKFHFVLCIQYLVHIVLSHNQLECWELVLLVLSNVQMDFRKVLEGMSKLDYDLQQYTMHFDHKYQRMDLSNVDWYKLD